MGSFDCYCALCSGPLMLGCIRFGSTNPDWTAIMKRKIENRRRRWRGEDVPNEESKEWLEKEKERLNTERGQEMEKLEAYNESRGQRGAPEQTVEDGNCEDEHDDDSDHLSQASELSFDDDYDFTADNDDNDYTLGSYCGLSRADVQWIDRSRVLAINPDIDEPKKAFLSGRGRYNDYFEYYVAKPGNDPRDTGALSHTVYLCGEPSMDVAFPIHEACYKVLTRCLSTRERKRLDKDVLHNVMLQHTDNLNTTLSIDYGKFEGAEQWWSSRAGEEWSVADPGPKPGIEEVVKSILPAKLFEQPSAPHQNLSHKVRHDPLTMLPYDIVHSIIVELPIKDMNSLMTASWRIHEASREPAFWRLMIRVHIMPFFWELEDFLKNTTFPESFDWRGTYHWLDDITKPSWGLSGPLIGIANRRRIWNSCLQLAPMYHEIINAEAYTDPSDAEAAAVMHATTALHTPIMMFPVPAETRTTTAQFIRSWSEIQYRSCDFCTYWKTTDHGELIGISVDFGSVKRTFGSTEGEESHSVHITSGDWIREIRVSFQRMDVKYDDTRRVSIKGRHDPSAVKSSVINGITVCLNSGIERNSHGVNEFQHQRSLAVLSGMQLIGLTGEIAPDGVISRLGLLQAPDPSCPPQPTTPSYPPAQLLRWDSTGVKVRKPNTNQSYPIWSHPTRSLFSFPPPSIPPCPSFLHPDMLSYTILEWKTGFGGISALQIPDENSTASIIGVEVIERNYFKYHTGYAIGHPGPVPHQLPTKWQTAKSQDELDLWSKKKSWDEDSMRHFEIDGYGGERVVEVHVSKDHRSFQLVTNRGREGLFGEDREQNGWHVKRAEEGEMIVGLSACFGTLGGWSQSAKAWSHWGLCNLGVLVARGE